MNIKMILTDLDGTLIHRHGEQIYSCNLEKENVNQIIQDILARDSKTEITVAAGRQVFWNSEHIVACRVTGVRIGMPFYRKHRVKCRQLEN